MNKMIPFSPPDLTDEEVKEVVDTLTSGWITTGPKTKEFERQIAKRCNTNMAVTMNSATSCMEMTLRLLGVGPGDEVITSAYTYTASASVIDHVGAKIVLVDTAEDSIEMDYDQLADAITERTKVIIPVDLAGKPCDYDKIFEVVESKKALFNPTKSTYQENFDRVIVMADAAHAFGASYKRKNVGEIADFTCFSFHAVKNLTTAEGGAVTWKSIEGVDYEEIYQQYMLLILHGQNKDALAKTKLGAWEYDIVGPYFKCNMTDIMASIGLVQLKRYDDMLARRKEIIEKYMEGLKGLPIQILNHYSDEYLSSGHLFITRIDNFDENMRNHFIEELAEKGITTNVHYKPLPMMTAYKNLGFDIDNYPNAFKYYQNQVTLPLHTKLTDDDIDYICRIIHEYFKH
ncbi:DegT/DnrJ/EryC1/StrS aminotransferase family protein [Globicatella sulfidifaciens]|uniref:DegT/DnrJ/EryC1/StrS family aminotransferase n=1 Tax=Globicatella sulfidifaciens TaxID=136093 RepID=UPI00288CC169|nr:DegT/DnrJ/EryC1/StrS aminotransferase family protein [Globicatella sulfidifaciens]MDT2767655.1 DegT/DnrJ/EryC1/StrS aminotransferase family protein [Globicatella sulfidifaciens]